ncbi:hypothetical protein DFAR_750008 [Desulfarculales bacterium]
MPLLGLMVLVEPAREASLATWQGEIEKLIMLMRRLRELRRPSLTKGWVAASPAIRIRQSELMPLASSPRQADEARSVSSSQLVYLALV